MIHIQVEWPEAPSLFKDIDQDIQSANFLFGGGYVVSYFLLISALWILFL